jgi:hypothetical protein
MDPQQNFPKIAPLPPTEPPQKTKNRPDELLGRFFVFGS